MSFTHTHTHAVTVTVTVTVTDYSLNCSVYQTGKLPESTVEISVFDLFSIGIGPSSSHTVGPMRAAFDFLKQHSESEFQKINAVTVRLHGSLAFTGIGHGTNKAILMGLEGEQPESIDPFSIDKRVEKILHAKKLFLLNKKEITFDNEKDLIFDYEKIF